MRQIDSKTRVQAVAGVTAGLIVIAGFALLSTLIFRAQSQPNLGASGCPSTSGKLVSSIVGAHFTTSSSTATLFFDSLVNTSPSGGVPGLIQYCAYYSGADPTTLTPQALGDDSTPFTAGQGSGDFAFTRGTGGPTGNIGLDGATHQMGTATWSGSVPGLTFLLHISDAAECHNLYGVGTPDTCFVIPSSGQTPTPTNTPAGVPTPTNTPAGVPTPTNTPGGPTATPSPTIIPTPTGTPHPK